MYAKLFFSSLDLDTNMINDETQPLLCKEYLNIFKLSDVNKDESCFEELIGNLFLVSILKSL